jgi:hypothetical protein
MVVHGRCAWMVHATMPPPAPACSMHQSTPCSVLHFIILPVLLPWSQVGEYQGAYKVGAGSRACSLAAPYKPCTAAALTGGMGPCWRS